MKIFSEAELIEIQNAVISLAQGLDVDEKRYRNLQELQVTIDNECCEAEELRDKVLMLIESYRHVKEALSKAKSIAKVQEEAQ